VQTIYPAGPAAVPDALTRASPTYRRQAWIAMLALLAFAVSYVGLGGWFCWKSYTLMRAALHGARDAGWLMLGSAAAGFIAVFMLKALFFVKRGDYAGLTEITARDHPRLFEFIYRLADEAKAARPRKVFLSPRVNAAVFYDLSPLNLLLPSRKNLEIGLALVNVLNLSEFKAVLAHEFGHFAQKSMAVGRWVYIAQQIAGHIVAHRDALDGFLNGLSRFDVRIAWIGWLLSLVVWAIRSVVDTFFRLVLVAERALSREMEFQADRVSVSLTGSDALIEALYRCQSADLAWDRTLGFANAEAAKGRRTRDLFEIQRLVIEHLRAILDDAAFGAPPAPAGDARSHRIFKKEAVQVSRMWATHPLNHEREENAKAHYLPVEPKRSSAWDLFEEPQALRERATAELFQGPEPLPLASREESMAALTAEYGRESYKRIYRGCYLARPLTRRAASPGELYAHSAPARSAVYPASLSADLKGLENLQGEKAQLDAIESGHAKAADGRLRFRGRVVQRSQLPGLIRSVQDEIAKTQDRLAAHDAQCRALGRELARRQGNGWEAYHHGLLRLVHYAEHSEANLGDAHAALAHCVSMATAKRKVSAKEVDRILSHANEMHEQLVAVHAGSAALQPGEAVMAQLGVPSWPSALGDAGLGMPDRESIGRWLDVADSWVRPVLAALGKLRRAAIDELLVVEASLSRADYAGQALDPAPPPPQLPANYRSFVQGSERPLQRKLDWWSRFQVADGWVPAGARLLVAGGIIGTLMGMSASLGTAGLAIHNGLDRSVSVQVGGKRVDVPPASTQHVSLELDGDVKITARTSQGRVIESFSERPDIANAQYVYNIASASPMVEWTAVYGTASASPERPLGVPRWFSTRVDAVLVAPPEQISGRGNGGTRSVLSGAPNTSPAAVLGMAGNEKLTTQLVAAHARWDDPGSRHLTEWLGLAIQHGMHDTVIKGRLADMPLDVATLRMEQEQPSAQAQAAACERHQKLAASHPGEADVQYLAVRCMPRGPAREDAFKAGYARYPANAWFAYAAAMSFSQDGDLVAAARAYDLAARHRALQEGAVLELARLRRLDQGAGANLQELAGKSERLRLYLSVESGSALAPDSSMRIYHELHRGNLTQARQLLEGVNRADARALRMVAASDGAPQELVQRSLALPVGEAGSDALWPAIGLAIRHGRPSDALTAAALQAYGTERAEPVQRFLSVIAATRDAREADAALAGSTPDMRAHAYVAGIVALGAQAPEAWRQYVKRVLFAGERPHFS